MSHDDAYGTAPAMHGVALIKAFDALPEAERREAIRSFVQWQIDREVVILGEVEPWNGEIKPGMVPQGFKPSDDPYDDYE